MIYFEPRHIYDAAIIRVDDVVVYDYEKLIEAIMEHLDCEWLDAVDWYCFNIECVFIDGWPIVEEAMYED